MCSALLKGIYKVSNTTIVLYFTFYFNHLPVPTRDVEYSCIRYSVNRIFVHSVEPNIWSTEYSYIQLNRIFGQPNTEYSNTEYRIRIFTQIFDIPGSNTKRVAS